jgi:predicted nucleotidyltransferase
VAGTAGSRYIRFMDRAALLNRLRAHEMELREMGVSRLSLFGSVARGEADGASDVDLAAEFDPAAEVGMIKYGAIAERLRKLVRAPVDLVGEPARSRRMQAEIERDRLRVY